MQNEVNYNKLLIDVLDSIEGKEISPDPCDPESGPSPDDIEFALLCAEMILRHIDCNYLQLMGFRGGKISYRWLTGPEANTIQTCNENFLRTQCVIVYDPREKRRSSEPCSWNYRSRS